MSLGAIRRWIDNDIDQDSIPASEQVDWLRVVPFIAMHLACFGVIWVGWSPLAVTVALALYLLRMFAITAFYHRYFSHRAFKTSRSIQFLFALIGATATQRGPLWWAAHHRYHHRHADTDADIHSPRHGFFWSHIGWFLSRKHFRTDLSRVADLAHYPELRWLNRFDSALPLALAVLLYMAGSMLAQIWPESGTNGWQLLVWGYFISTVALLHATLLINSLAHRFGRRRYATHNDSRNNLLLALLTLGEGWHNNHHHYPGSARQGFYWWEIDISYYVLKLMATLGLIWDLKPITPTIRNARLLQHRQKA